VPTVLCFQAEVLTPLVIAGADPKSPKVIAEGLRPPSLRGAMRWWFRAMMGGIVGPDNNYKTLRDLEGEAFGSTTASAAWQVRTRPSSAVTPQTAHLRMNDPTPIHKGKRTLRPARDAIGPGVKFKVELSFARADAVPLVLQSLWLFSMLGGLGNRARRGFGSLTLAPVDEQTKQAAQELSLDFSYPATSLANIAMHLGNTLTKIHGYFSSYTTVKGSLPPAEFFTLSRSRAKLYLLKPLSKSWSTWNEAMDDLRCDVYRPFKGNLSSIGLAVGQKRLASPLLIQIKRSAQKEYFGVLLAGQYSNPHLNIEKSYFGKGWAELDDFLNWLASYEHQEVLLP
jgi:CRISPR-associated protein Cmr1